MAQKAMLSVIVMAVLIGHVGCFSFVQKLGVRAIAKDAKDLQYRQCQQLHRSIGICKNLKSQAAREGKDGQIISNPNEDWKPDHQKAAEKSELIQGFLRGAAGNQDTPDYLDEDAKKYSDEILKPRGVDPSTAGDSTNNKLKVLLSADNTEIREVEKLKYKVEFKPHKWRIDGDHAKDPTYAPLLNTVTGKATSRISVAPNSMTFEDFVAGFSADSSPGWEVTPREGQMDRKVGNAVTAAGKDHGKAQEFEITYHRPALDTDKADRFGTLVIVLPNDNWSWTYKFKVSIP